jgi:hypothetical protein
MPLGFRSRPARADARKPAMKGTIFNELRKMVGEVLGEEAWDDLVERTPLVTRDGVFIGPQVYPDEDLAALVKTASEMTGKPEAELVHAFGRYLFPNLARLHPVFLKPGMTAKSFLKTVDQVIHVEVRKLHPGAILPAFTYEDPAPDRLVMLYRSPRRLCDLVAGLIEGVGTHYGETIGQRHTKCLKQGDPACRFELTFA